MAKFSVSFPSNSIELEAEDGSSAFWKLARYFGKLSDGAPSFDPEFHDLGIPAGSAVLTLLSAPAPAPEPPPLVAPTSPTVEPAPNPGPGILSNPEPAASV